jgi:hypothetical protein
MTASPEETFFQELGVLGSSGAVLGRAFNQ